VLFSCFVSVAIMDEIVLDIPEEPVMFERPTTLQFADKNSAAIVATAQNAHFRAEARKITQDAEFQELAKGE